MSNNQAQHATGNHPTLTHALGVIFGVGATLKAELKESGEITFTDEVSKNTWTERKLPDGVEFFGPGFYEIKVHTDYFEFTEIDMECTSSSEGT
jgi:hypothetical protein